MNDLTILESDIMQCFSLLNQKYYAGWVLKDRLEKAVVADPEYLRIQAQIVLLSKHRKDVRSRLMRQPELWELNEEIKKIKSLLKDTKKKLSGLLRDYEKVTGREYVKDNHGRQRKIKKTYDADTIMSEKGIEL